MWRIVNGIYYNSLLERITGAFSLHRSDVCGFQLKWSVVSPRVFFFFKKFNPDTDLVHRDGVNFYYSKQYVIQKCEYSSSGRIIHVALLSCRISTVEIFQNSETKTKSLLKTINQSCHVIKTIPVLDSSLRCGHTSQGLSEYLRYRLQSELW